MQNKSSGRVVYDQLRQTKAHDHFKSTLSSVGAISTVNAETQTASDFVGKEIKPTPTSSGSVAQLIKTPSMRL